MPSDSERVGRENSALDALIAGLLSDVPVELIGEPPPGGLLGSGTMSNANTTAGWATSPPDIADLTRKMGAYDRRQDEDDQKVFVFGGTPDEFYAECRKQGIGEGQPDSSGIGGPIQMPGMEVIEFHGKTYVGTREAIRRLLDGPLKVKRSV